MKEKLTKNKQIIFTILLIIYEEILFISLTNYTFQNTMLKIIFSIQIATIVVILTTIFSSKINKILYSVILTIVSFFYIAHFIYYETFGAILSIYSISNGTEVFKFGTSILNIIIKKWYFIILFLLPLIIYFLTIKKIETTKINIKVRITYICMFLITYICSILIINLNSVEDIYSSKNLYYNINNMYENLNNFGIITSTRLDIQRTITNFKEKQLYVLKKENGTSKVINIEDYNMLNIDFDKIIKESNDETLNEISQYLSSQEPTNKNEYTGIFEGKNLIFIVGESFSSLAIREDLTPTLYKLSNTGFKFENFYTPLFPVSTADGQYLTDTSILPAEGVWSIEKVGGNYIPYSYANLLKEKGYQTYAYHNYDYNYYKRDEYFKTFGYETYLGKGNGLEEKMDFSGHPSSDYDMIEATIADYINDEKFLAYYITMSGHMDYTKKHNIVSKNWNMVKDLPYSDNAKGYLATQIEFDKAVEKIINELKEKNKLDDTVIVICGDHYPYGLSEDEIKSLSPYNMSNYNFEKFHMPLIIYNNENVEKISVEKYASSLDILPTILNLFGLEYDSRLLMGKDIFSNSNPFVIFSDRSFITEKGKYDSRTNNYETITSEQDDIQNYIKEIKNEIYLKYRNSRLILENDYYKTIKNYLE